MIRMDILRSIGALSVETERRAADWQAMRQELVAAGIEPAGAGEIVRRLRHPHASPLSVVPQTTAAARSELIAARPDIAETLTDQQWTAYLRGCAGAAAQEMAAVRALQRADAEAVGRALLPTPGMAREAVRIVRQYRGGVAGAAVPAGDCPGCRLVTDPIDPISPNQTKETPDAEATPDHTPATDPAADPAADDAPDA